MQASRRIIISRLSTRKLHVCCCEFNEKSEEKAQKVCPLTKQGYIMCVMVIRCFSFTEIQKNMQFLRQELVG